MTRAEAREILNEMTQSESLLRHMRSIELVMEAYAKEYDEDPGWLQKTMDILVEKEGRWRLPIEELDVLMEKEDDDDDNSDESSGGESE